MGCLNYNLSREIILSLGDWLRDKSALIGGAECLTEEARLLGGVKAAKGKVIVAKEKVAVAKVKVAVAKTKVIVASVRGKAASAEESLRPAK